MNPHDDKPPICPGCDYFGRQNDCPDCGDKPLLIPVPFDPLYVPHDDKLKNQLDNWQQRSSSSQTERDKRSLHDDKFANRKKPWQAHDNKPNHKETHMSKSKNYRLRFGYQSEANLLLRYLNLTPDQAKDYAELLTSLFDYLETTPTYIEDEEDGLQEVDSLEAQRFLKALEKVRV